MAERGQGIKGFRQPAGRQQTVVVEEVAISNMKDDDSNRRQSAQ
jgi:hypothetical protein